MGEWLWSLIPWGYRVLLAAEGLRSGALTAFMSAITDLGSETGYVFVLTLVYWCVDKSVGRWLSFCYLYAAALNLWIKDLWSIPRPDDPILEQRLSQAGIARRLSPLRHEDTPSFISGHTQGATVAWGYLAVQFRKGWFRAISLALIVLIGLSRIYLGAHFPQDVIGGFVVGAVYLGAWLALAPHVWRWLSGRSRGWLWALAIATPLATFLLHPTWNSTVPAGAALGLGVGYVLEERTVRFSVAGGWRRRLLRGALGLAIVLAVYLGLSAAFSPLAAQVGEGGKMALRMVRYAMVGVAGGWAAPKAFTLCKLADRHPPEA